jgi:hypothetical protein
VNIEVEQDERRSGGGYAILRISGVTAKPSSFVKFRLLPVDDGASSRNEKWASAIFESSEATIAGEALNLVVGPEVVNSVPADIWLRVQIDDLSVDTICWWPSLTPAVGGTRGQLPQPERSAIAAIERPPPGGASVDTTDLKREPIREQDPIEPDKPAKELAGLNEMGHTTLRPDSPQRISVRPEGRGILPMALGFVAGLLIGIGAAIAWPGLIGFEAVPPSAVENVPTVEDAEADKETVTPASPQEVTSDRLLLETIDTGDVDDAGRSIFATAAREWLRQGDLDRNAGNTERAALNYRRALRAAWHESRNEKGEIIDRLAGVLSSNNASTGEFDRTIRVLMTLSIASGDAEGMCRLATVYEHGIGGEKDPAFAASLRERAKELLKRLPIPTGRSQACQ